MTLRDDGVVARALAPLGRGASATPLALLATVPPLALLAATGADGSHALIGAAAAWLIVVGGVSVGGRADRFAWLVPGLLRTGEYALLLWIGSAGCADGPAAGFAVIFALTLHHYDLAYRPRHLGAPVPPWVTAAAGGWDGRLVVAWVLLAADALPAGLYVMAAALAAAWLAGSPLLRRQGDAA